MMAIEKSFSFYEFFAGAGMVRAGLGADWQCLFANDYDFKKARSYIANWGSAELLVDDIRNIKMSQTTGSPDLIWGSFPCQDLSLAGGGAGLTGDRSGTFWPFIVHMNELKRRGRAPSIIALENVMGTLTSNGGKDFQAICAALDDLNYIFGAVVIDAVDFVPQSRPRLFILAIRADVLVPSYLHLDGPDNYCHPIRLEKAFHQFPEGIRSNWRWWKLGSPPVRSSCLADLLEEQPSSTNWHTKAETQSLIAMMSDANLAKLSAAKVSGQRMVGAIYKRTRYEMGQKFQRAEIRFDNVAGCLRTPGGGSSRQSIMIVDGETIRSRLISTRETARLMGLPDEYKLPAAYNEAYHLTGDGVAVPVVTHISRNFFEPVLLSIKNDELEQAA